MKNWFKRLFASHKTALAAVAGAAFVSGVTAAQTQLATGHIDIKSVGMAAAGTALTTIAALAKSPLTPASAQPKDNSTGDGS